MVFSAAVTLDFTPTPIVPLLLVIGTQIETNTNCYKLLAPTPKSFGVSPTMAGRGLAY